MPGERRTVGLHLAWLLAVAATSIFVTALIAITGDLETLWPLYVVPIVIAALAYEVAGAVVTLAICAALSALLSYASGKPLASESVLVVGAVAYAISGIVIGIQAHSYRKQRDLLEVDSVRDPLTSAFTAAHLRSLLGEELTRAERYGLACSFVAVEPVGFEEFRHTYGRVRAEQLLCRLLEVVRTSTRETDVIGRWGHEAFGVVLPMTDASACGLVVERITDAVAATEFEGDALEPTTHCPIATASVTCPDDGTDTETIVAAIEARLDRSRTLPAEAAATSPRSTGEPPQPAGATP